MSNAEEPKPPDSPQQPEPVTVVLVFLLGPLIMGIVLLALILSYKLELSPLAVALLTGLVVSTIAFAVVVLLLKKKQ